MVCQRLVGLRKSYKELTAAKSQEVKALDEQITAKTQEKAESESTSAEWVRGFFMMILSVAQELWTDMIPHDTPLIPVIFSFFLFFFAPLENPKTSPSWTTPGTAMNSLGTLQVSKEDIKATSKSREAGMELESFQRRKPNQIQWDPMIQWLFLVV